ncbi:hypothetical protein RRG08_023090 [Elysia crispata]|uniref:Uncharacterized protein n=1 Tax=Elysia crispata TaxID=231223 RepID=A0AAE1ARQ1_9GAST|nr:hypothetical protein RRG08_023090 [Elysia crispata]
MVLSSLFANQTLVEQAKNVFVDIKTFKFVQHCCAKNNPTNVVSQTRQFEVATSADVKLERTRSSTQGAAALSARRLIGSSGESVCRPQEPASPTSRVEEREKEIHTEERGELLFHREINSHRKVLCACGMLPYFQCNTFFFLLYKQRKRQAQ